MLLASSECRAPGICLAVAIKQLLIVQLALFVADKPALEQSLICATNSWPKRDLPRPIRLRRQTHGQSDHRRDPP